MILILDTGKRTPCRIARYSAVMVARFTSWRCVLLIPLLAGLAHARPQPERAMDEGAAPVEGVTDQARTDNRRVSELVAQLNDDDWLQRDLATIELGELDPGITLEMLERQLGDHRLSHEQRARLTLAAMRRFAQRPKGALGVSFGTIRVGAIEVQPIPVNPDFPASEVLLPGDLIAMVAERVIDGSYSLRAEIISRSPGETLPITVVRAERVLHLDLRLGSLEDLTGAIRMDTELLHNALALRWERLGLSQHARKSIGEGLDLEAWSDAAFPPARTPDPRQPNLRAPRGWIVGEEVRIETSGSGWSPSAIDIWTSRLDIDEAATKRGRTLSSDRIEPIVALRQLLELERAQLNQDLQLTLGEQREAMLARLDIVTARLEAIRDRIERTRQEGSGS